MPDCCCPTHDHAWREYVIGELFCVLCEATAITTDKKEDDE